MQDLKVVIIVGTSRENRESIKVVRLIEKVTKDFNGFKVKVLDPIEFNFSENDLEPTRSNPGYKK